MISYLCGTVQSISGTTITLVCNDIGITVQTPCTSEISPEKKIELYTHLHWNSEKGPSMYGFASREQRTVFLLIIDCPKIGPARALAILATCSISQFIQAVSSGDEKVLSAVHGIGTKKAEQIIAFLKHKVQKLIKEGAFNQTGNQDNLAAFTQVSQVLASLNYSPSEINDALMHLSSQFKKKDVPLDQLIRASLAHLAK